MTISSTKSLTPCSSLIQESLVWNPSELAASCSLNYLSVSILQVKLSTVISSNPTCRKSLMTLGAILSMSAAFTPFCMQSLQKKHLMNILFLIFHVLEFMFYVIIVPIRVRLFFTLITIRNNFNIGVFLLR